MMRWVIFLFLAAVGARDLQREPRSSGQQTGKLIKHLLLESCRSLPSSSPFGNQLFDGDVGPHLSGKARERVLLLGQMGVQLRDVGLCLQGDVQTGLQDGMEHRQRSTPNLYAPN